MPQKKTFTIFCFLLILCNLSIVAQSAKTKKMYKYYASMQGTTIKTVPKFAIQMGASLMSKDPLIKKLINKVEDVKIMTINSENTDDIEDKIPGKNYEIQYHGTKDVWVKRCLMTVKEAHLVIHKHRKTQIISIYGHVNVKYLKKINEEYIKKGKLPNIPFLN